VSRLQNEWLGAAGFDSLVGRARAGAGTMRLKGVRAQSLEARTRCPDRPFTHQSTLSSPFSSIPASQVRCRPKRGRNGARPWSWCWRGREVASSRSLRLGSRRMLDRMGGWPRTARAGGLCYCALSRVVLVRRLASLDRQSTRLSDPALTRLTAPLVALRRPVRPNRWSPELRTPGDRDP
jgi:hypothetical protein